VRWKEEKGQRMGRPRLLMTSFGCLDSAMPESNPALEFYSFFT
jgi:hypothetical protein